MARRYTASGTWTPIDTQPVGDPTSPDTATIVVEAASALDRRTGQVHRDGARRVRIDNPWPGAPRARSFFGEMAWADAHRLADDWYWTGRHVADVARHTVNLDPLGEFCRSCGQEIASDVEIATRRCDDCRAP